MPWRLSIPIRPRSALALLPLLVLTLALTAHATPKQHARSPFTFYTGVREVLTDVTVTDSHGNPVSNLSRADFHIYDNGQPQKIISFTPHHASELEPAALAARPPVYSNNFLTHPPPIFNVILIDVTTMTIGQQMYLYQQLALFLHSLPANQPVAVYGRVGPITELYQNFTANHALLHRAIRQIIPRIPPPDQDSYNDDGTLIQMADFLSQYPGRKNILWFTGGSNFFLTPNPSDAWYNYNLRDLYDALESERIALYPIDVRGLVTHFSSASESRDPSSHRGSMRSQHLLMQSEARATGGHAYYNTNGIAFSAQHVMANTSTFYTLAYSPNNIRLNNRWHRIHVIVTAPTHARYHLSYRRGYFDDGSESFRHHRKTRTLLRAHGITLRVPNHASRPVIFQARVTPVPNAVVRRGKVPYAIQYRLPASSFHSRPAGNGMVHFDIGAAALAYDSGGSLASRKIQKITLGVVRRTIRHRATATITLNQQIRLPTGHVDLYLAIWDNFSGRLGTLQIPLSVPKNSARP